jgi:hypothetical protein
MTYETDPVRWTDSPENAPDVLRAPLAAGRGEGPSDLQMKALALKLAALSAGTAAAASAATAKASTTAGGAASVAGTGAGTFSLVKIAVSVALLGATVGGVVLYQGKQDRTARAPAAVRAVSAPAQEPLLEVPLAEQAAAPQAPSVVPGAPRAIAPTPLPAIPKLAEPAATMRPVPSLPESVTSPAEERSTVAEDRPTARAKSAPTRATPRTTAATPRTSTADRSMQRGTQAPRVVDANAPSEVELLRRARSVLGARPREAFALTEEHRRQYPAGTFAQERDALAIEALLRAGDRGTARDLAERFIEKHPSSPHAHRFRETMGIR